MIYYKCPSCKNRVLMDKKDYVYCAFCKMLRGKTVKMVAAK